MAPIEFVVHKYIEKFIKKLKKHVFYVFFCDTSGDQPEGVVGCLVVRHRHLGALGDTELLERALKSLCVLLWVLLVGVVGVSVGHRVSEKLKKPDDAL